MKIWIDFSDFDSILIGIRLNLLTATLMLMTWSMILMKEAEKKGKTVFDCRLTWCLFVVIRHSFDLLIYSIHWCVHPQPCSSHPSKHPWRICCSSCSSCGSFSQVIRLLGDAFCPVKRPFLTRSVAPLTSTSSVPSLDEKPPPTDAVHLNTAPDIYYPPSIIYCFFLNEFDRLVTSTSIFVIGSFD